MIPYGIQDPLTSSFVNTSEIYVQLPEFISTMLLSFTQANYCAMITGCAIHNFLTGKMPTNLAVITNMPPSLVLLHFKKYPIQPMPSGLHQIKIADLKIDISYCDSTVFTSNIAFIQDVLARVFTVNALYCDAQGMNRSS